MKKILFFLLLPLVSFAQKPEGILFEQGLNLQQLLAKAKAEHKYLFVDAYASWCGPCKLMDRTTYTDEGVGAEMKKGFISVKVQMDKTSRDLDSVKFHYADAEWIQQAYPVSAYPTFLFFSPDGKLVHKGAGYLAAGDFIKLAKAALDTNRQYYTLLAQYKQGRLDSRQEPYLALTAAVLDENELAGKIAQDYLDRNLDDIKTYTPETLRFLSVFTIKSSDAGFRYFLEHTADADKLMGQKNFAENVLERVVIKEDIDPVIKPDWSLLQEYFAQKYNPIIADRAVTKARIFRSYGQNWPEFTAALVHYTEVYEDHDDSPLLVKNAKMILAHSNSPDELNAALAWCKSVLQREPGNEDSAKVADALRAKSKTAK